MTDEELAAIRERFRELDALNDAENPDDDRDRFDKALRVRAWACAWDVEPLLAEVERLKVQLSNYAHDRDEARRERDKAERELHVLRNSESLAEVERDRLRAEVAELKAQRNYALTYTLADGYIAEPAPAEPAADQQARDEADLADINRRAAAEQNVLEKAKAWRAALPWQTGVPRDDYTRRLADTQDALCTAVDALPADSHVAPTNSQTWEQDRDALDAPILATVNVIDVAQHAIALYGREKAEAIVGANFKEHDYRFELVTPGGGNCTFNDMATAANIADWLEREQAPAGGHEREGGA